MNCNKAQRLCQEYLDGGLPPEEEWALRVHCKACGECEAFFRDLDLLDRLAHKRYGDGQGAGCNHAAGKLEAVLACARERKLIRTGRYRNLRRIAALLLVFAVASFSLWCAKRWALSADGSSMVTIWGKTAPWGKVALWGKAAVWGTSVPVELQKMGLDRYDSHRWRVSSSEGEAPSSAIALVLALSRRNCAFSGCAATIPWKIQADIGRVN